MLILIIVLVLVFGFGGGYFGYSRWGTGGGAGIGLGTVLVILLICYLLGFSDKGICNSFDDAPRQRSARTFVARILGSASGRAQREWR